MMKKLKSKEIDKILKEYEESINVGKYKQLVSIVEEYFDNPKTILLSFTSEYNDETYDNKLRYVSVYGADDVELGLTLENKKEFLDKCDYLDFGKSINDDEPMEDIVIRLNFQLPTLYVED